MVPCSSNLLRRSISALKKLSARKAKPKRRVLTVKKVTGSVVKKIAKAAVERMRRQPWCLEQNRD
jgi:hypothetical protein